MFFNNFFLTANIADTINKQSDTIALSQEAIKQKINTLVNTPTDELISSGVEYAIKFGLKVLVAVLIYFIGGWIIKRIRYFLKAVMEKRNVEPSLMTFIISFTNIALTIILIIIVIASLGIDTTSFVALLAGSGLAIGMALSGTLQNFAGGIMILLFKPFKVGDYIEAQGYSGTVKSIEITSTHITTVDNRNIILPNGNLINNVINNYSTTGIRRCDWDVSIAYGDNVSKAREVILNLLNSNDKIILEPEKPVVYLKSLADSAVIVSARAWVKSENYWSLYFEINESIYNTLPNEGANFPFPQMDVHLYREQNENK